MRNQRGAGLSGPASLAFSGKPLAEISDREATPGALTRLRALPWSSSLLAGLGAFMAIGALVEATSLTSLPLIIAPFGASCALVFGAPASPLAHPRNVIGGHLISAALGLLAATLIGYPPLAMAVGVGFAIAGMLLTGTLHPPAGANPIVVVLSHATWSFVALPVLAGATAIVVLGALYHRLMTGHPYGLPARR